MKQWIILNRILVQISFHDKLPINQKGIINSKIQFYISIKYDNIRMLVIKFGLIFAYSWLQEASGIWDEQ